MGASDLHEAREGVPQEIPYTVRIASSATLYFYRAEICRNTAKALLQLTRFGLHKLSKGIASVPPPLLSFCTNSTGSGELQPITQLPKPRLPTTLTLVQSAFLQEHCLQQGCMAGSDRKQKQPR